MRSRATSEWLIDLLFESFQRWGLKTTDRIDLPFLGDRDNLVFGIGGGESIDAITSNWHSTVLTEP